MTMSQPSSVDPRRLDPRTPVIIGVGQVGDRLDAPDHQGLPAAGLAAAAARAAAADAGARQALWPHIDAIGMTRTFEDSRPRPAPFGRSDCLPRSVTRRLGIDPAYALWVKGGGNTPQELVTELAGRIAGGEFRLALIAGAEAISTIRQAARDGRTLDFAESPGGQIEDRGPGYGDFTDAFMQRHGINNAPLAYGLIETARRARLGQSRDDYALGMGRLFAPFAAVAHRNPRAAWSVPAYSAQELISVGPGNRWIATPYPLHLVARDQVNLGAALFVASVAMARELGVPEERWVYLHGHAHAVEKPLLERADLGASPAARRVSQAALMRAGVDVTQIGLFDFYSCFPVAVSNVACDAWGLAADDPRGLTVTGGLPFFGGPGNNYSMHAITEMVERLRARPGGFGFVGANGGYLSKYAAGVYSTRPAPWQAGDDQGLQRELDRVAAPIMNREFSGEGVIETYAVQYDRGGASSATVIGRNAQGQRFLASSDEAGVLARLSADDALGLSVRTRSEDGLTRFRL